MNLFEYQGKELYKKYGIDTPKSFFITELENLKNHNLNFPLVVKSQVQVGGRGKAGGIKVAKNEQELEEFSKKSINKAHDFDSKKIEEREIEIYQELIKNRQKQ